MQTANNNISENTHLVDFYDVREMEEEKKPSH